MGTTSSTDFRFDERLAERPVRFFREYLRHVKGEWAGQPFELSPWQEDLVRTIFGWVRPDGTRRYRTVFLEVPRKNGKALAIDTPVPTPDGWKLHGELRPGDLVFGPDGEQRPVRAVTPHYVGECYAVRLADGAEIIAHANHEWLVTDAVVGEDRIVTTAYMARHLTCWRGRRFAIGLPNPLRCADVDLPIPPYTLGVWLGDGTKSAATVCLNARDAAEIVAGIRSDGEQVTLRRPQRGALLYALTDGDRSQRARNECFQARLRSLGLLGDKHIPDRYLRASARQRRALLRGLLDTDGYVSKAGQCELVLGSEALFAGAVELLRSLGLKPTVKVDRASFAGRDYGPRYRAQFWAFSGTGFFSVGWKASRLKKRPPGKTRSMSRKVVSVTPVGERTVNCIEVEGGLYLAGEYMVPTHNSTLSAGLALYLLFADREPGAEVYSAAADRDQAAIVFDIARSMVQQSPRLAQRAKVLRRAIVWPERDVTYKVLSADAYTKHGLNAHGIVFDELHAQPNRELWDVLTTSTGARRQPLVIAITTAGYDRNSICYEIHDYAEKVRDGVIDDPSFLPVIYAADEDDDWRSPETWAKANPGLGVSIKLEYLEQEARKAEEIPAYQNTFRRLHLNQWTEQDVRWLDVAVWDEGAIPVDPKALTGRPCYAGLDLSTTTDISALVLLFPPQDDGEPWQVLPHFWIPEENVYRRVKRDRVPFDAWVRDGFVEATPGNVIDYEVIRQRIGEYGDRFDIQEIAIDRWNAAQITTQLMDDGFVVVPFGQGFASMSAPSKELEKLVVGRQIAHGGHPVLRWMASNVAVKQDPAGNLKPDKARSRDRIDGIVALVMALGRAVVHQDAGSVYDERGFLVL